jgi:hypothetical protein
MPSTPNDPDREPEIADAALLFGETSKDQPAAPTPRREVPGGDAGYELRGSPESQPEAETESPARPQPAPRGERPAASGRPTRTPRAEPSEPPEVLVPRVWNRWGEWGPSLLAIGAVLAVGILTAAGLGSSGQVGLGALVLLGALAVAIVFAYPIAITVERPVRMTPEQAARDYFAALSHHIPQYRRAWMLLSARGCGEDTFADFVRAWRSALDDLRAGRVARHVPIDFRVTEFRSDEKTAGKTTARATLAIRAVARRQPPEALGEFRYAASFARGPDRQWYLDEAMPAGMRKA